jgi:SPOR domain
MNVNMNNERLNRSLPQRLYNPLYDRRQNDARPLGFNRLYLVPIMCLLTWAYVNFQKQDVLKVEPELTQMQKIRNNRAIFDENTSIIGELGIVNDPHVYNDLDALPNQYDVNVVQTSPALLEEKNAKREQFKRKRPVLNAFLNGVDSLSNKLVFAGSFANQDNAEKVLARLKSIGYEKAEIIMKEKLPYKVVVTGFYNHDKNAKSEVNNLTKRGIDVYSATRNMEEIYRKPNK